MNFREAFDRYNKEREEKFIQKNATYKDEMHVGTGLEEVLELEIEDLWCHFYEELHEFEENEADPKESFDVSNMAFLIWWHGQETLLLTNSDFR